MDGDQLKLFSSSEVMWLDVEDIRIAGWKTTEKKVMLLRLVLEKGGIEEGGISRNKTVLLNQVKGRRIGKSEVSARKEWMDGNQRRDMRDLVTK